MPHKPFNLYKRLTTKNGRFIYYVQFYDESGNRLTARSTGQTTKSAAETWAFEQLKKGYIVTEKNITFGKFAEDWWVWGKCPYTEAKKARGFKISRAYIDSMNGYLRNHVLPFFKNKKLQKINSRIIEKWVMNLKETKGRIGELLTPTTVNRCLTCLKIMLNEAVRLDYLLKNPTDGVGFLKQKPKIKSILSMEEVRKLFDDNNLEEIWAGDIKHFTLNLLAASTGMRAGECLGLQRKNVNENYVAIIQSWDKKYGFIEPKWGSVRNVPIPSKTFDYLHQLISASPFQEIDDLVFFGKSRSEPIRNEVVLEFLYKAFENIGISKEERKERNITFHSWRHFFNSFLRGRVNDVKIRKVTGHKTLAMTEHYTHFNIDDFRDVLQVQEGFWSGEEN